MDDMTYGATGDAAGGADWLRLLDTIAPTTGVDVAPTPGKAETSGATSTDATAQAGAQHIRHGRYEARLYERAGAQTPRLTRAVVETAETWPQAAELAQDVFHALYQPQPETQAVADDYADNARAIDAMFDTSDYQALHEATGYDELAAAIGAASLTRRLAAELAKQAEEQPPEPPLAPQPPEPPQGDDDDTPGADVDGHDGATGDGGQHGQAQAAYAEAMAQYAEAQAAAQAKHGRAMKRHAQRQATNLRVAARAATGEAQGAVADYKAALGAFMDAGMGIDDSAGGGAGWGRGGGQAQYGGDITARAKLATEVARNPRLRRIATLAGRMRRLAQTAQRRKAEHRPEQVVGVTRGDNLERVLPAELALLADPTLQVLFMSRYAERGLMQYKLHGTEPQGRGPIILCVDESGSMGGTGSEWGAAVGLYLRAIAAKEKRDFLWLHFGSAGQLDKDEYPMGRGTPAQLLASATHFFNGGTDFDTPLRAALDAITTARYAKADVVFATDGICAVSPDVLRAWNDAKKARDFTCFGVLIGHAYGATAMRPFCDDVSDVLRPGVDDSAALSRAFSV